MICFFRCVEMTRPWAVVSRNSIGSNPRAPLRGLGALLRLLILVPCRPHWSTAPAGNLYQIAHIESISRRASVPDPKFTRLLQRDTESQIGSPNDERRAP